jgi:predicted O-methyltransferase YrrM
MTNSLAAPQLSAVLSRLFAAAARDHENMPPPPAGHASWTSVPAVEHTQAWQDLYVPVSPEAGNLLYALVRASRPEMVVEFGTSFGISTIYLAAAVTDNGTGHVVSTELSERKATAARANLQEAGLDTAVTIKFGDALETLRDVAGPIGLVLLDGWKDLYLPVLRLLQPKFVPGTLVAADDSTFKEVASYLDYIRDPANGYVSVAFPVGDGVEISSWTGA